MGKREENRKMKLIVLRKIKQKKNILFGAFSIKITKEIKMKEWKEISDYAKSIGVIPENKEWTYLRDVWWPNVRKLTKEKLDNAKSTGSREGKDKIWSDVDMEVWEIMRKDSPAVTGLDVPESLSIHSSVSPFSVEQMPGSMPASPTPGFSGVEPDTQITERSKPQTHIKTAPKGPLFDEKRDLQIGLLKIQIYKSKLECRKLEMEMNLPKSSFTSNIPEPSEIPVDVMVDEDEKYFNDSE